MRQANDAWFEQQRFQTWGDALAAAEAEIGSLTADQTAVLQQFYTLRQGLVVARADQETIAQVSILLATYFEHDVPLVLVPTLFLSGGRAGHPPDLSRLVGRVSDLRFELVPGASHELFLQGAQPVTSRILAFAQSLAGWSQSPPRPPVSD